MFAVNSCSTNLILFTASHLDNTSQVLKVGAQNTADFRWPVETTHQIDAQHVADIVGDKPTETCLACAHIFGAFTNRGTKAWWIARLLFRAVRGRTGFNRQQNLDFVHDIIEGQSSDVPYTAPNDSYQLRAMTTDWNVDTMCKS